MDRWSSSFYFVYPSPLSRQRMICLQPPFDGIQIAAAVKRITLQASIPSRKKWARDWLFSEISWAPPETVRWMTRSGCSRLAADLRVCAFAECKVAEWSRWNASLGTVFIRTVVRFDETHKPDAGGRRRHYHRFLNRYSIFSNRMWLTFLFTWPLRYDFQSLFLSAQGCWHGDRGLRLHA